MPIYAPVVGRILVGLGVRRLPAFGFANVGRNDPTLERHQVNHRVDAVRLVRAERMMVVNERDRSAAIGFVKTDQAPAGQKPASCSAHDPHRLD